jgi:STE24 endopeptidase
VKPVNKVWLLFVLSVGIAVSACRQPADKSTLNIEKETRAYVDRIPRDKKAQSDAYFEGGYWLQLWGFVCGAAIAALLVQGGLSARMRDLAQRISRFKPLQTGIYAVQYLLVTAILSFPLTVYSDFFREHHYGLSNQNFSGWFGDWAKGLMVSLIIGSVVMIALFGIVRRLQRTWHIWGALVTIGFLVIIIVIGPVYIAPLFNKYTVLNDAKVVDPILRLARANGIAADKVYEMDASKQSKRVSANVSGFLGTMRITLNDNLLNRSSLPEIEAVMGHEMGHYVMNHVFKMILFSGILVVAGFALSRWSIEWLVARYGARWGISGVGDVAVTPLAVFVFSTYLFILTPFTNSFVRMQESEADTFGLNAARQPDGMAEAALKLGEYRKMEPGPIEEWIFFDHPSGATRMAPPCAGKQKTCRKASPILQGFLGRL